MYEIRFRTDRWRGLDFLWIRPEVPMKSYDFSANFHGHLEIPSAFLWRCIKFRMGFVWAPFRCFNDFPMEHLSNNFHEFLINSLKF